MTKYVSVSAEMERSVRCRADALNNALSRSYSEMFHCGENHGLDRVEFAQVTGAIGWCVTKILEDNVKNANYVAFSCDCHRQISYAPPGVNIYDNDHRVRTTLNRFLRRNLSEYVSIVPDKILEDFCFRVMRHHPDSQSVLRVIKGRDIIKAYEEEIGGHSCMTGYDGPVEVYAENDCVSMLVFDNCSITARALVWDLGERVLMDRIYPNSGYHVEIMHEYARSKGWLYRSHNSLPSGSVWMQGHEGTEFQVQLESSSGRWPYMDTFHYLVSGDEHCATLSNSSRHDYCFDSTDGDFADGPMCDCCECQCNERTRVCHDDWVCDECLNNSYTWCEIEDVYCHNEDAVEVSGSGGEFVTRSYAEHNLPECRVCLEYYFQDDTRCLYDGSAVCDDCFEETCGECYSCDEGFVNEELHEHEGRRYCKTCLAEEQEEQLAAASEGERNE